MKYRHTLYSLLAVAALGLGPPALAGSEEMPVYQPADENLPNTRREAGLVDDLQTTSVSRGLARGLSRGLARGLSRGLARGLSRGLARGLSRGLARGLLRGEVRNPHVAEILGQSGTLQDIHYPALLAPLAPAQSSPTSTAQPTLYWYISSPWPKAVHFTLNQGRQEAPVAEFDLLPPAGGHPAGIHPISLAERGISLEPGKEYEWFVSIVPDSEERSADLVASATIEYRPADEGLRRQLAQTPTDRWYFVYAQRGLWYDALHDLSSQIARDPGNPLSRLRRAALIEQVHMPKIAQYDRVLAGGIAN